MKQKIIVVGFKGKMGSVVFEKLLGKEFDVVGIDVNDNLFEHKHADLLIDFSSPKNTDLIARWCLQTKTRLIVGTTGQSEDELNSILSLSDKVPIMKASNFSAGIAKIKNALNVIVDDSAENIAILEKHHKEKKDCPSGTALMLKDYISNLSSQKIEIFAERSGDEVGIHSINVHFENEVVSITHKAFSRECFADGAVLAVEFLLKQTKPRQYYFEEIFVN